MFNFGTNVVVTASSLAKNKSGPRVGSFGFMAGSYNLPSPKYIDKELSMLFIPQRIIFTNFGFETKVRMEEKIIIGILPIPRPSKNFDEETTKLFANVHNTLKHKKLKKAIKDTYGWKCKPICMVVPNTLPKQLINENDVMFAAWTKAVLKSNHMCNILSDVLSKNSNIFKKKFKLNLSIIEILLRMSANTEIFDDKIDMFSKHYKKETIRTISWLNTIIIQHSITTQMKKLENILISKSGYKFNRRRAIETIGKTLFSPLFYKLCLYAKTIKRKEIIEFMDNMIAIRIKSANLLL